MPPTCAVPSRGSKSANSRFLHQICDQPRSRSDRDLPLIHGGKSMATLQEFRCEVCGLITTNPTHWFVIRCGNSDLTVYRWNSETAQAAGARHYCGEAHAEVYISRWFDSVCAPPKPNFT